MPNVLAEGYGETPFPDFPQVERRESRAILVSFGIEIADGIGCNPM